MYRNFIDFWYRCSLFEPFKNHCSNRNSTNVSKSDAQCMYIKLTSNLGVIVRRRLLLAVVNVHYDCLTLTLVVLETRLTRCDEVARHACNLVPR